MAAQRSASAVCSAPFAEQIGWTRVLGGDVLELKFMHLVFFRESICLNGANYPLFDNARLAGDSLSHYTTSQANRPATASLRAPSRFFREGLQTPSEPDREGIVQC